MLYEGPAHSCVFFEKGGFVFYELCDFVRRKLLDQPKHKRERAIVIGCRAIKQRLRRSGSV